MIKVIGIDPGTKLWGIVGLEGRSIIYENSFPTKRIIDNPELLINILNSIENIDLIVAPSGYGIPITNIKDLTNEKIFELTLKRQEEGSQLVGLGKVIDLLIKKDYNAFFIPGVKLLPTIPKHRKINKIDMGTADKVCTAALAIYDQSKHLNINYTDTNFILLELGSGFTAVLGVEGGKIVDGIGGSSGPIGFISGGAIDGELAYYIKNIKKSTIYQGGITSIIGSSQVSPEEFNIMIEKDNKFKLAFDAFIESVIKNFKAMTISVKNPKEILLSGRISYQSKVKKALKEILSDIAPVRNIKGLSGSQYTKEAAQGAALIANGLAGGDFRSLVECMKLIEAKGSIFDDIYYKLPKRR
ncbi:MAG: DUF1464 domain-containing protein [Candidatus Lokiarchaeota archaeon]|nr:DUF1464 domain-containing protein [Candidatus Lokiarchaeota archaeon]